MSPNLAVNTPRHRDGGFALILALSLMSFIVLLLLSFVSLTRIQTQRALASKQQLSAQCNARLALYIALGELQKTAGPDQRVTATADLASEDDLGETYSPGKSADPANATDENGLTAPMPGTRYWTGVWGNERSASDAYTQNPEPRLLNWLVSGNEGASFTASVSNDQFGIIEQVGNEPIYDPSDVSGVAVDADSRSTGISFGGNTQGVILLGKGTVGSEPSLRRQHNPSSATELPPESAYVAVPLVEVGTGADTDGRYAWWVGDEGVKAQINLNESQSDLDNADYFNGFVASLDDITGQTRYAGPPRNAVELITGLDFVTEPQIYNEPLEKLLTLSHVEMMPDAPTALQAKAVKARYHDITLNSTGVLADSLRGGLRKDLTHSLANSDAPFGGEELLDEPGAPSPSQGPTWRRVQDFWNLSPERQPDNQTYGRYDVRIGSKDSVGIAPIISKFRFVSSAEIRRDSSTKTYDLRGLNAFYLVLGNPYRNALFLPRNEYELSMRRSQGNTGKLSLVMNVRDKSTGTPIGVSPYELPLIDGATGAFDTWSVKMWDGTMYYSQDGFSKGDEMKRNFSSFINLSDYAKSPHEYMKLFEPNPLISVPEPTNGGSYTVTMELVETGNLEIDVLIHETGDLNRVLTGVYNYDLAGSPGIGSGDQDWNTVTIDNNPIALNFTPTADPTVMPDTTNLKGAVAGGYTLVLNAAGNSSFDNEPGDGVFYQTAADANMLAGRFTDAGGTSGVNPASVFAYHGGYIIPDTSSAPSTMKNTFIDTTLGAGYTLNAWGRRTTYQSGKQAVYTMLPTSAPDLSQGDYPFLSLADMRLMNLSGDDESYSVGHQPTNILGNSYHNVFVPRTGVEHSMEKRSGGSRTYYDMCYLLNTSLWDRYFFSSLPQSGGGVAPLNRRLEVRQNANTVLSPAELRDTDRAAKHLNIAGAFNINSTSPEAWRAVIGAMNRVPLTGGQWNKASQIVNPKSHDTNNLDVDGASFPRYPGELTYKVQTRDGVSSRDQIKAGTWGIGGSSPAWWYSHRLNEDEIIQLSEDIAREVRKRGPFLSLSHFVNRRLSADDLGRTGALQAALDVTRVGGTAFPTDAAINSFRSGPQRIPFDGDGFYAEPLDTQDPTAPGANHHANRMKGLPGWVMQADLLGSLGSFISARSDTFVIRTYGDAIAYGSDRVEARAYLEAVVQRLPEYVDPADTAEVDPVNVNITNQNFGRRFVIRSIRTLASEDI